MEPKISLYLSLDTEVFKYIRNQKKHQGNSLVNTPSQTKL